MHGQYVWQFLALLALLKIVATTLSFTSGTPGGMFAPTLFIGAMLGGAVGGLEHIFIPHPSTASNGTYVLVGMGVLFVGFRAPMTSSFHGPEVSGNYETIVPVIVANTFAYVVARSLQPTAIFDLLTRQDGLVLPSLEEEREEAILRVEDATLPAPAIILSAADYVDAAARRVEASTQAVFPVRLQPSGMVRGHARPSSSPRQRRQRRTHARVADSSAAAAFSVPRSPARQRHPFRADERHRPGRQPGQSAKVEGIVTSESASAKYGAKPK